jgi:glutamine amidotransferase
MKIAVIRYNAGNIQSIMNALERLGYQALLTDDFETISSADKVIFPGVGEASSAMKYLEKKGLIPLIKSLTQPVLGICLGMQLLGLVSEENNTACLGIVPSNVKKLIDRFPDGERAKVPHIGWNTVKHTGKGLFKDLAELPYFYFVHSYAMELGQHTIAETTYSETFSSAVQRNNFYGVQFHPEKSAEAGSLLLQNFLSL